MSIKRKYVDSHWLIFAFQGVIALLFGWFALFTNRQYTYELIWIVGGMLLCLGIFELINLLSRSRLKETWGFSLISAIMEIGTSFTLLLTLSQGVVWHLALIAGYTVVRGALEVLIGLKSIDDKTDRFIWVLAGACGVIIGFVILNSGQSIVISHAPDFIKYFGVYLSIYGICNLIYGIHNYDQSGDLKAERSAKKLGNTVKTTKQLSKVTKKKTASRAKVAQKTAKKIPSKTSKTRKK